MNSELLEALNTLEKEKDIKKDVLFDAIENSLVTACKNHFGKADNVKVEIDRESGDFNCYYEKEVVNEEDIEDDVLQISLEDAQKLTGEAKLGDVVKPFTGANMTLGNMFLRFDTRKELDDVMSRSKEWLKIETED